MDTNYDSRIWEKTIASELHWFGLHLCSSLEKYNFWMKNGHLCEHKLSKTILKRSSKFSKYLYKSKCKIDDRCRIQMFKYCVCLLCYRCGIYTAHKIRYVRIFSLDNYQSDCSNECAHIVLISCCSCSLCASMKAERLWALIKYEIGCQVDCE